MENKKVTQTNYQGVSDFGASESLSQQNKCRKLLPKNSTHSIPIKKEIAIGDKGNNL